MKKEKTKHDKLCNAAIRWLYDRGCCIFLLDSFQINKKLDKV